MKTHAFIICWPGKEAYAKKIAEEIINYVDFLTVIYSTKDDSSIQGAGNWHKVPDDWYYGKKFEEILKFFNEDLMIQIHADTEFYNWEFLIEECKTAFITDNIGIWAPDFNNTAWDLKSVLLKINKNSIHDVCQTDCIIWALNKYVCNRLSQFNYSKNNIGWGIDWAAICFCYCNNFRVIRDSRIFVDHHLGSGYIHSEAFSEMKLFLNQMNDQEKNMLNALQEKIQNNKDNK